jgi:excisionase family DNA binding protein
MSSNIRVNKICIYCGNEFEARKVTSKTCSDSCAKKLYKARIRQQKVETIQKETSEAKEASIEILKAKEFLSIAEASILLGISRRTVFRMIERGELKIGKAGRRTIIKKTEIETLFKILN